METNYLKNFAAIV